MTHILSSTAIATIKETSNLVASRSEKITKHMYTILFKRFPSTKALFSNSSPDQYMKLAEALSAYAVNIEKLERLTPALKVIAHSHVMSHVKPSHYPMVGMALIQALEETLQEEATPSFIDAWREAYQYLADILITLEKEIQAESSTL